MRAKITKFVSVVIIIAMTGCTTSGPAPVSPKPSPPPVSFDGNYQGTIRLTASGVSGAENNWCDTPPAISLSVRNGAFSYVLAHPNVPRDSADSLSPTFAVAIAPDGSFDATSRNGEAEMIGHIVGSHMTASINGTGCNYAFSADRP
jgi:hypothetical protein